MVQSTWQEGIAIDQFPMLQGDSDADVVIIGGGITGITTAYLLSKKHRVVLLEKDTIGQGATGLTTAFLTQNIDTNIADLISMLGEDDAKLVFDSHANAITTLETIITQEQIDCDFMRCANYFYANDEQEMKDLTEEKKAGSTIGIPLEMRAQKLGFKNKGHIVLPNQAKFHPLKYIAALTRILKEKGVAIYEHTEVKDVKAGSPHTIVTDKGTVTTPFVVSATYAPLNNKLFLKKAWYASYVIEATVPSGLIPEGIYEDNQDPYHYFRIDHFENHDRMIIGGEDHRSDIPVDSSKSFQALEDYMQKTFADISYTIVRKWRGPIIEPVDGRAFIGPLKEKNIFYATGFSGNGMTYSIIAALMITDMINGKKNPWEDLYRASRRPALKDLAYKGRDFTKELIGGAVKNTLTFRKKKKAT